MTSHSATNTDRVKPEINFTDLTARKIFFANADPSVMLNFLKSHKSLRQIVDFS